VDVALLALHGQPGSGRDFDLLARALEAEHHRSAPGPAPGRLVAPDRPGWGRRAAEPAGGFAAGADDAVRVLDEEGVEQAVVLGFSWGGGVALEMARRHADRVGALVLAASIGPGEPTALDRLLARPVPGRAICAGGLAATRLVLRRRAVHGILSGTMKGIDPAHVRHFGDRCLRPDVLDSFMVEQQALVREFPAVLEHLGGVRVPAVVVTGDRDRLIAAGSARRLAEAIPGAELRVIPGAGHFLPGAAAPVLAEVLTGVAARVGA
jgi:pimeloyl-ACP methyl ester carboxylesterase